MKRILPFAGIVAFLIACGSSAETPGPGPGPGAQPDLVVAIAEPAPAMYLPGRTLSVNFTVSNQGQGDAEETSVHAFLGGSARPGAGVAPAAVVIVPALATGANHDTSISIDLPADLAEGDHTLWLQADGEGVLEQEDRGNDWASFGFTVTVINNPTDCSAAPDALVTVPDEAFRAVMVQIVRRDTGSEELTCGNLAQVRQLSLRNRTALSSLEGIQYLTGATLLTFENAPFPAADASLIAGMTAVERLTLQGLPLLTDISFVANLELLETFILRDTAVTSLAPLTGLQHIRILWADDNRIGSVDPLGSLPALELVSVTNNQVRALGALANAPAVDNLKLGGNPLTSLAGLGQMTNLRTLELNNTGISSVPSLSALTQLETVNLSNNNLTDIAGLRGATSVRQLYLAGNSISDLDPLSELTSLSVLLLQQNVIANLEPLSELTGLRELNISGNLVNDLRPLNRIELFIRNAFVEAGGNCLGVPGAAPTLYPHNNQTLANFDEWGVRYNVLPFLEADACDV